jgi:hypothetical protein
MKKIAIIAALVIVLATATYAAWYSYARQSQIAQIAECQYELEHPQPPVFMEGPPGFGVVPVQIAELCPITVAPPSLWDLIRGRIALKDIPQGMKVNPYSLTDILRGRYTLGPNNDIGCDQSATTTDCSLLPPPSGETGYFFPATFYTEFAETAQSGEIDSHLIVDNTLIEVTFCGNIYRTRQIFIDGTDVVRRLAALADEGALPKDSDGRVGLCQSLPGETHLRGIIETGDVKSFDGSDAGLPGTTYLVSVAANGFDINPQTGNIYQVNGYDGSIGDSIGTLWKTYTNKELGISFAYPPAKEADEIYWGIGGGDTGRSFHANIKLPSSTTIYAHARTKDYSVPKGGPGVATEGFVTRDGGYYAIRRGIPSDTPFTPDDIWALADGSLVPVQYGKNYDQSLDYPDPAIRALLNLRGAEFTGIGFVLWNMNDTGSHPASAEDRAIFKKIITSVTFVK